MNALETLESRRLLHADTPIAINFQPVDAPRAPGMLIDYGSTYDVRRGGMSYGWDADVGAQAVDRNSSISQTQRNDTFIATQGDANHTWEIGLENGIYQVYIVAGDPSAWNDRMAITVEGDVVVSGVTKSGRRWLSGEARVTVDDGRLTIGNAPWAVNNKIAYLAITPMESLEQPAAATSSLTWATGPASPIGRAEAAGGAIGNKLYVFGGYLDNTFRPTDSSQVYDYATSKWSTIKPLPERLSHVGIAKDSRYFYLVGGYPATATAQTFSTVHAYRYDTSTNTYTTLPNLPAARGAGALAMVGRTLYFMGGADSRRVDSRSVWMLNLDNLPAGWIARANLPQARNHPAAAVVNGDIYFLGGQTGQDNAAIYRRDVYRYHPSTNTWTTVAPLPTARSHITASTIVVSGKIMVLGGEGTGRVKLRNVDLYDPATNAWTARTSLPAARYSPVAGFTTGGRILVAGGYYSTFEKTLWIGTPG